MARKLAYEHFKTINELVATNSKRPENKVFKGNRIASKDDNYEFRGTHSYAEAESLLLTGWDEYLEEIKKGNDDLKSVKENVEKVKRMQELSVVGYAPHVPNAIMGVPQSMIYTKQTMQKVKAVTLIYGMTVNCNWEKDELLQCGLSVLKIINLLELQGVRVQLTVEIKNSCTRDGKDRAVCRVDIKDWREALDLRKVAFPVAHPSMFRRIGFRWLETCPLIENDKYVSGYGTSPEGEYEAIRKTLKEENLLTDNQYYINPQLCQDCNQDILEIVRRAGITGIKLERRKGA